MDYCFCITGSDNRMKYVYRHLFERGLDVYLADDREYLTRDYQNIILIAPPNPSCKQLKPLIEAGGIKSFFGGALNEDFYMLCSEQGIKIYDYLDDPEVVWENAVLTARGIAAEAIKTEDEEKGRSSLILGYGNCGRALSYELKNRSRIFVAVRNRELKAKIEAEGNKYVNLCELSQFLNSAEYSYIYNTIPAMVLDKAAIDCLKSDTVIYDIAQAPGGTDFDYCSQKGIAAYLKPGIPGRCYPDEAGRIIAAYISRIIFDM